LCFFLTVVMAKKEESEVEKTSWVQNKYDLP
jgi:hypothetical protein